MKMMLTSSFHCIVFNCVVPLFLVPIVPDLLYQIENNKSISKFSDPLVANVIFHPVNCTKYEEIQNECRHNKNSSHIEISEEYIIPQNVINENGEVGLLFASKALVQLAVNPIVGPLTNR